MIKKLIIRSSVLLLFGIIESILAVQNMELVEFQNSMLDSFPNVMYNKVLGIQKLQYNPGFTSTHTEHVFKTKKEDI